VLRNLFGGCSVTQSFRDLVVWQKAMQLTVDVYELTRNFPREETYGLSSQMRRAAVSLPSNIAEGHGRLNRSEYRQFLGIARASNFELQTQLELTRRLSYGDSARLQVCEKQSHEVGKLLYAILESIKLPREKEKLRANNQQT
jgi:four helix bundle protein